MMMPFSDADHSDHVTDHQVVLGLSVCIVLVCVCVKQERHKSAQNALTREVLAETYQPSDASEDDQKMIRCRSPMTTKSALIVPNSAWQLTSLCLYVLDLERVCCLLVLISVTENLFWDYGLLILDRGS